MNKLKRKCKGECQDTYHNMADVKSIREVGLCVWCFDHLSKDEKKEVLRIAQLQAK
jgi:hypothetical protein